MKLQAEISGQKHTIEVTRDGNKVTALIDDRSYELEASEPESNVYLLKYASRVFEVYVSPGNEPTAPYQTRVGATETEITLIDPKRLRGSATGDDLEHGAAEIKTAMPGKVVRILAAEGTEVQKGDGVIVVEAMKMQNEMKAPKAGVIKEIRAQEGSTVAAGDVLVVIE